MYNETIGYKRLWAWLAVAMSAPLAHFSGDSWLALLVLGVICWGITALLPDDFSSAADNRLLCVLQLAWTMLLLSQLMPLSAAYWPGRYSEIVVPGVLLALGAYSCDKRGSRVAGVLFWVLVIMYIPVTVAGIKDVQLRWLIPQSMEVSGWLVIVLLLPCAAKVLPSGGKGRGWYPGILMFGLALGALTTGVLSPGVAAAVASPFRELSRGLSIGAASRFEALISVTVTLGWFCLGGILIRCGSVYCKRLGLGTKISPWLVAAGSVFLLLADVRIPAEAGAVLAGVLWVAAPVLCEKILSKKREKKG